MFKKSIFGYLNQILNYAIPVLVFPYLLKHYGLADFGRLSLIYSILIYANVVLEYGFNITTVNKIVETRNNIKLKSEYFWNIYTIKAFFLIVLYLFLFPFYNTLLFIPLLISSFFLFGNNMIPTWYFIAQERLDKLFAFNIISKLLFFVFIYLITEKFYPYYYTWFYWGVAALIAGVTGLFTLIQRNEIIFIRPNPHGIVKILKNGRDMFLVNLSSIGLTQINIIILYIFASPNIVGSYSISEKAIFVIWQLLSMIIQIYYPSVVLSVKENRELTYIKELSRPFLLYLIFIVAGCLILYAVSETVVTYFNLEKYIASIRYFKKMIFIPIIVYSNIPASLFLMAKSEFFLLRKIYLLIFIFHVCLISALTYYLKVNGAIISMYVSLAVLSFFLNYEAYKLFNKIV